MHSAPSSNSDSQSQPAPSAADASSQAPAPIVEQSCLGPLPQPIQYGDSTFRLMHCGLRGNQVRLTGRIEYDGSERVIMYFHPFKMFDDAANAFAVQEGRFGSSQSFGTGHSDQTMYPHSSVPFSLAVGP